MSEDDEAVAYGNDEERWAAWLFTEDELVWLSLEDHEREQQLQIDRLRQMLAFFEEHPACVPHVSPVLMAPNHVPYQRVDPDEDIDAEERWQENDRRQLRAQVRVLRDAGFEIEKEYDDDGGIRVRARRPGLPFRFTIYSAGYCKFVETGMTERVSVTEVPDEVAEAYTRIEQRPVTKRVCVPLLARDEMEREL